MCLDTAIASRSGRTERSRGKPRCTLLSVFRHVKPHFGQNGEQTMGAHLQLCSTSLPVRAALSIAALHQKPQNHATWPSDQLVYSKTFHCIATRANGTLFTAPRRSVARRSDGPQKPGSDQNARAVAGRLLNPTVQEDNTPPPTSCRARPAMVASGLTIAKSRRTLFARPTVTPTPPNVGRGRPRANKAFGAPDNTVSSLIWQSLARDRLGGHTGGLPPCMFL